MRCAEFEPLVRDLVCGRMLYQLLRTYNLFGDFQLARGIVLLHKSMDHLHRHSPCNRRRYASLVLVIVEVVTTCLIQASQQRTTARELELHSYQSLRTPDNTTTVVMKYRHTQLAHCSDAHAGDSDSGALALVWLAATLTTPAGPRLNAPATASQSPTIDVLPLLLVQPAPNLDPLFYPLTAADCHQPRVRHHRQCDMTVPAMPEPHFVLIQACFALGFLDTLFNTLAMRRHFGQFVQCRLGWRIRQIVRDLGWVTDRAARQQPATRPRQAVAAFDNPHTRPIIHARSFFAFGNTQALPGIRRPGCHHGGHILGGWRIVGQAHLTLRATSAIPARRHHSWALGPDWRATRHRQDIATSSGRNRLTQVHRVAIDLIPRHPAHRYTLLPGMLEHRFGLLRLGLEAQGRRDFALLPSPQIVRPLLGQIQPPVQEDMAVSSGIRQQRGHLAVVDLAGGAAILTRHTHRGGSFLEEAGFIDNTNALAIAKLFDDEELQAITGSIGVPVGTLEQALHPIGRGVAAGLGQLPAILAFKRCQQGTQVFGGLVARFAACKQIGEAGVKGHKVISPMIKFLWCHWSPPGSHATKYDARATPILQVR